MLTFLEAIKGIDEQRVGVGPLNAEGGKAAKDSVDYSPSTADTDRCALCEHYDNHACSLVAGDIDPGYWCDLFEAEHNWAERDCTRSEAAKTGDPLVDFILQMPVTARNIDSPIIDRSQPVPYGAGGSVPLESAVSFVDSSVPHKLRASGVAFDPADPWVVHENSEQRAMELLIAVGIDPQLAYRFSHFCVAEVAEAAWYRFHHIDPAEAEAVEKPILDRLRTEQIGSENTNPALYVKPYPHDCEALARTEMGTDLAPTPEEEKICRAVLMAVLGLGDTARDLSVTESDVEKAVRDYLSKHAPEIARLVKQQPSVSDVHAPSALGNDRRRKKKPGKACSFRNMIATAYIQETEKAFPVEITKLNDEKQYVYGWASVSTVDGQSIIDKQGDIIPIEELEKAAHDFVQFSRDMGDMHQTIGVGRMIGSWVFTKEIADVCKMYAFNEDGKPIEGWAVAFHVIDPESWRAIKSGERPELSIGGRASWDDA